VNVDTEQPHRTAVAGHYSAAAYRHQRVLATSQSGVNPLAGADPRCEAVLVPEDHFGDNVAAVYDESSAAMFGPEVLSSTVDLLAELAGDGAALEFAIGTGRVALPLAARGVPVSGIELSIAMVDRLYAKAGP
jgi:hypothetical protein